MNFEKKKIEEIEKHLADLKTLSNDAMLEFYTGLKYLEKSKRYKENKRYKAASFWDYIEDQFQIRQGTYRENVRAFVSYPAESKEYGVGLVSKVMRVCKAEDGKKVFKEIEAKQDKRKTPVRRDEIEKIIQEYAKEEPKITKTTTDWRAMYEQEKIEHGRTRDALLLANKEIDELKKQVEKLKKSAAGFVDISRIVQKQSALRV